MAYDVLMMIFVVCRLTAFVIKVFCQAREFIFVDESVICSAMSWLAKQQLPSGSFKENKPVVHKEMMV